MRTAAIFILACSVPLLAACGSDGPTTPRTGTLRVELTDDPTDQLAEINVFITGLTVKHSQSPVERIADEIGLVDLLSLQDTTQLLAAVAVESGTYQYIRVDLDEERSHVVEIGSGQQPLQIASEEVRVLGGFEVEEGGTTTVTLDFDAAASIRQQGDGGWLLVPVIVQANTQGS